ncbi:MAG TPA: electron transport complex subunit RsxE [Gemmatimonadota bacterium]|nr:electron transport complex subunit RsxE [Gemmatimonadota bacterium]
MSEKSGGDIFLRGVWEENPVLIQILGLCPTLAVTNTVENAVAMALATAFVLVGSSGLVSLVRRIIPDQVRISAYILIIATFVTVVDLLMAAVAPSASKALGPFVPLIVVNCMILGRAEAFASKNPFFPSILDAAGTSSGFAVALLMMGGVRELLGSGSLLGLHVLPGSWEPWVIMILPPGGFLTLGVILMGLSWWWRRGQKADETARPRRWPHGVREPEERAA